MSNAAQPNCQLPSLPTGRHYRYHTMVKPAGALCNLDCSYCFYLHKTELLGHDANARMGDLILEQHIRQYIESQTGDEVVFSWQGGEPTIMGLDFFERVVAMQASYAKPGQRIENDLQTNGILLDQAWGDFLKRHRFLVGLSIDGPRDLHDKHRYSRGGQPSFERTMAAARLLAAAEIPFAALCVVNRDVARQPLAVYRFLARETGAWRIQFTPCVEPQDFRQLPPVQPGKTVAVVTEWSVDPGDYGNFLCDIWDDWLNNDFGRIHVNLFETAIAQSLGLPAQSCVSAPICGKAMALEHDGSLYACDHFVYPQFRLGNILDRHEGDLAFSRQQVNFGLAKRDSLPGYCRDCAHLTLCWGECPKNRLLRTPAGEPGLNYLCSGLQQFYSRVQRDMPEVRRRLNFQ